MGVAGTVDCIAEYEGELAVIDFKTSKKPKPEKWIEHYYVQCAAYACMLYEMTGIMVKKFVIIMSCENGECVVYEQYDKRKYINLLSEYIREFVEFKFKPMPEENINELIEKKFYSSKKFAEEIEKTVLENKGMKYMDAIIFFCEKNNVDVESVPKLVSKPLKEKLKAEAMELNLLKRTSRAKLPL